MCMIFLVCERVQIWAVKNIIFGPLKNDLGIVTWAPLLVSGILELNAKGATYSSVMTGLCGCIVLDLHFLSAAHGMKSAQKKKKMSNSEWFAFIADKRGKTAFHWMVFQNL